MFSEAINDFTSKSGSLHKRIGSRLNNVESNTDGFRKTSDEVAKRKSLVDAGLCHQGLDCRQILGCGLTGTELDRSQLLKRLALGDLGLVVTLSLILANLFERLGVENEATCYAFLRCLAMEALEQFSLELQLVSGDTERLHLEVVDEFVPCAGIVTTIPEIWNAWGG